MIALQSLFGGPSRFFDAPHVRRLRMTGVGGDIAKFAVKTCIDIIFFNKLLLFAIIYDIIYIVNLHCGIY